MPMTRLSVTLLSALVCAACASAPSGGAAPGSAAAAADSTAARTVAPRAGVLATFVGQPLVIVPTQQLQLAVGAPAWAPQPADARGYLAALDDEIVAALRDRGVVGHWVLPEQVVRSARRNPTFASDPHTLSVEPLLPRGRSGGAASEIADPLRSQLRAITALSEDARFVLVPVVLRFERAPADSAAGRAVLHLALVDTRLAQVRWTGDVASDDASSLSPAVVASLADRVATLAAAPR